jgi:peroxiredoxin
MHFKNILGAIALSILISACETSKSDTISISGMVSGVEEPHMILAELTRIHPQEFKNIDTLELDTDGSFSTSYPLNPGVYSLTLGKQRIPLALDSDQHLYIEGTGPDSLTFTGSDDTTVLHRYESLRKRSLDSLVTSVRRQVRKAREADAGLQTIADLRALEVTNYQVHLEEMMDFVKREMQGSIALAWSALRWTGGDHLEFLKETTKDLNIRYPDNPLVGGLQSHIELLERTSVGGVVPDIILPDTTGKQVGLSAVKGTYTLVDFWASWCGPCRTEVEVFKDAFEQFGDQGFQIFAISMDTREQRWKDAIETDGRDWPNVSSLQGLRSEEAIRFGVTALPTNFLIDSDNRIVARDIHGEELMNTLKSLFED